MTIPACSGWISSTRPPRLFSALAIPIACLSLVALPAEAATRVWLNPVSGNWAVTNNWSGGVVPGSSDNAFITNGGTFTVTVDAGATFSTLILGGADGTQSMDWAAGSLAGTMTVGANGALSLVGPGAKTLSAVVTNSGRLTWTSGSETNWNWINGRIENRPGALVDVQVDGRILWQGGVSTINNAGTFRKSAGTNALTIDPLYSFNNTGLVDVQSGTLPFANGFTSSGTFNVATNTAVQLTGGTFNFNPGHTFTGGGFYGVTGSATINGPIINANFQMSGAITFNGELSGTLWWNSGSLDGALTVDTNGVLNLVGSGAKYLYGIVTNYGQIAWISGSAVNWYWANGRIENRPGGLIDVQLDGRFFWTAGIATINNAGTFRKSAGTNTLTIDPSCSFTNGGLVEVVKGTVRFPIVYSETPSATLAVSLGGTNAGTQYGLISFVGTPTFAGKFAVSTRDGFRPAPGNAFSVLSYPSALGDFIAVDGLDLGSGLRLEPRFTKTSLTLTAADLGTNALPRVSEYRTLGSLLVVWPIEFTGWELSSATNLLAPAWLTVPIAGVNDTVVPFAGPEEYFRLETETVTP